MPRRGTELTPQNRFLPIAIEVDDDCDLDAETRDSRAASFRTTEWFADDTQSIVSENHSPDVPFRYSLNPYRGCEHGCAYCYARTYHEYLGWNAGTDFESKILVKSNAAKLLRRWLCRAEWNGKEHLAFSGVTDPYQPIERKLRVTRSLLEVLCEARQAVSLITKNALIERDIDLLAELARYQATQVAISITTLDKDLARLLEPRCSVPDARLRVISQLASSGIPVHLNIAPIIPGLNDHEVPRLLEAAAAAGAKSASWILLRLPGAVEPIFVDWLDRHRPLAKNKIIERLKALRQGKTNDPRFGERMRGDGFFSEEYSKLFAMLLYKYHLEKHPSPINVNAFRPPREASGQGYLF